MIDITMSEFLSDPEKYLKNAVENDDFFTVQAKSGKAVVISEAEWNIMRDALKAVITHK